MVQRPHCWDRFSGSRQSHCPPTSPGTGVRCSRRDLSPPKARSTAHRSSRSQKQSLGRGGRNAEGRGAGCTLTETLHAHPQQVPTAPQVLTGQGEPPDHGLGLAQCCPGAVRCLALSPNPTTPHTHRVCVNGASVSPLQMCTAPQIPTAGDTVTAVVKRYLGTGTPARHGAACTNLRAQLAKVPCRLFCPA